MNEKLKVCVELASNYNLDENSRYNLRQTAERRSRRRQRENLILNWEDINLPEFFREGRRQRGEIILDWEEINLEEFFFETNSDDPLSNVDLITMTTTAIVTTPARFVGTVNSSDPEKKKKEKYDVDQFLADVDSRIANRGITADANKIKEALLLVDPEDGDAHSLLTSSIFSEITSYADFKEKCKKVWKPKAFKDKFYNLQELRTFKKKGLTDYGYMGEIRKVIDRVVSDLVENPRIEKIDGGKRDQNIDAREVITYVAFSTIFESLSEDNRRAFRKYL